MTDDRGQTSISKGRRVPTAHIDDPAAGLVDITQDRWLEIDSEERMKLLADIDQHYHGYLQELYVTAELCVDQFQKSSSAHRRWRRLLIIGTGVLAILNLLATKTGQSVAGTLPLGLNWLPALVQFLPMIAAICAVVLAILANLESFYNWPERAQSFRESRELFLDANREFERAWAVYVRPQSDSPEAWSNAVELYKRLVAKDRELRSAFKELTKFEKKK